MVLELMKRMEELKFVFTRLTDNFKNPFIMKDDKGETENADRIVEEVPTLVVNDICIYPILMDAPRIGGTIKTWGFLVEKAVVSGGYHEPTTVDLIELGKFNGIMDTAKFVASLMIDYYLECIGEEMRAKELEEESGI